MFEARLYGAIFVEFVELQGTYQDLFCEVCRHKAYINFFKLYAFILLTYSGKD